MNRPEINSVVVELFDVTKTFGGNQHKTLAIRNVSLRATPGELLLILGPSGSGKTTLLTLSAGLIRPSSGTAWLFNRNIQSCSASQLQEFRARRIGFVFQTFHLIDSLTALENVALVLRFAGKTRRQAHQQASQLLQQFQIGHLSAKFPQTLSQGEKQRVAVARAIANGPDLIIADEPTASLETKQGLEIIQLLHKYSKEQNRCVIVASHDLRIVTLADRVLRLEDGVIADDSKNSILSLTTQTQRRVT